MSQAFTGKAHSIADLCQVFHKFFPSFVTEPKRLLVIIMLAIMLPGCSSVSRYVISNNSDEIVTINYSYPAYLNKGRKLWICPIKQLGAFPETTLDELSDASISWQKLSANQYVFNGPECSVKVAIIAGASVTFATHDPFREKMQITSLIDADLIRLSIQNEKAHIALEGIEIFKRFEQTGKKLHVYYFP